MSGASAAAAVLQRPLLLHLPRPPKRFPVGCISVKTACGASRFLQPLKLPELPCLNWSQWRRHRGIPCLLLQRDGVRIFCAAGAGGGRLAARKSEPQEVLVLDAKPLVTDGSPTGLISDAGALNESVQAEALPKKRGRGRPKASPLREEKNAQTEVSEEVTVASLAASFLGSCQGADVTKIEKQNSGEILTESATTPVKPRRGRPKKTVDCPSEETALNGPQECKDSTLPQKTKQSKRSKAAATATGLEAIPAKEVKVELPTEASGGQELSALSQPALNGPQECKDSTLPQKTKQSKKSKAAATATGLEAIPAKEVKVELPAEASGGLEFSALSQSVSEHSASSPTAEPVCLGNKDAKLVPGSKVISVDSPSTETALNGPHECIDSILPLKTKQSKKPKAAATATGLEAISAKEVKVELNTGASGGKKLSALSQPVSEHSAPSPTAEPVCLGNRDAKLVHRNSFATEVARASMAQRASRTETKGERVKKDEGPRNPSSHASSGISFVQILGTGMDTGDTSPSVLLFFDKRRLIFNAGEGLQRFCIEHKIKLSKIDHLFLTRVSSETANGIPGLLLTLAGIGDIKAPVDIWGTSELQYFVDAMRTFVPNASFVNTHSFGNESPQSTTDSGSDSLNVLYHDEYVKVSAALLHPLSEPTVNSNNEEGQSCRTIRIAGLKRQYDNSFKKQNDGVEWKAGDISVVYVCELPEVRGRFDPAKAISLGIRPGRKYSDLQNGKSVPRDDNTAVVHPHQVMAPSSPGPIFVLVDCPTADHIPCLLSKSFMNDFYPKQEKYKTVSCMVHLGPATVTSDSDYQQWMALLSETNHILAGHGLQNLDAPILKSSARVISRLNYLCPQVFPNCCLEPEQRVQVGQGHNIGNQTGAHSQEFQPQTDHPKFAISTAANLMKFRLRPLPAMGVDRSSIPENFCFAEVRDQLKTDTPEIEEIRQEVQRLWVSESVVDTVDLREVPPDARNTYPVEEPFLGDVTPMLNVSRESLEIRQIESSVTEDLPDCLINVQREEMEMVFLGTGSSQPSKYRNVSAIFINLFSRGCVLLDCGEGTYGQLKRRYGLEGADAILMGLKCVWISHIHADHHTGLSRILAVRRAILDKHKKFTPVLVIGPRQLRRYLDAYSKLEDLGMVFLDCSHTTAELDEMVGVETGRDGKITTPDGGVSPQRRALQGLINYSTDKVVEGRAGSPRRNQMQNYWVQPGYNQSTRDEAAQSNFKQVLASLGLQSLESVPVVHCPQAYGVILQSASRHDAKGVVRSGWKLAYSGDTRPCKKLLEACEGATVLIHEATFDDGMAEEAKMKRHSMTCEAIETGRLGNVFRTILTHFSQRYPKIPVFDESYTDRTCIAFDMMSVNLADLPVLPKLLPALKLLFRDDMIGRLEEAAEDGELVEY